MRGEYDELAARLDKEPMPVPANGHQSSSVNDAVSLALRCAAGIPMEPVSWLWHGWIAQGKLHVLAGVPGTGKTTIALSLAAVVTKGGRWPDGAPFNDPGNVLIWSGEDDAADTLVPRLTAMGADLNRVHFVADVTDMDGKRAFDPAHDMPVLIEAARKVGVVRLLIVDPVVVTVAGDSHKNAEVRRGLAPLNDFARELHAAVLGISHFNKGSGGKDPLDRLTGSLAFGAVARLVFGAAKKVSPDGEEQGRVFVRVKSNLGPDGGALAYSLANAGLQSDDGRTIETSRVQWGEVIQGNARDILADAEQTDDPPDGRSALDDAKAFLDHELRAGSVSVSDLQKRARDAGIAWATVRRAKDALGITASKAGMSGGWTWGYGPKALKTPEDAHAKALGTFDEDEHLRGTSGGDLPPPAGNGSSASTDVETF